MKTSASDPQEIMARCAMATGKIDPGRYELARNKVLVFNETTGEKEECLHIFSRFVPGLPE